MNGSTIEEFGHPCKQNLGENSTSGQDRNKVFEFKMLAGQS